MDVSDALAVHVQAPPAPRKTSYLYGLPRTEDENDRCVDSAAFSDIHPVRCPLPLSARACGPGCCGWWRGNGCGGRLRRCASRGQLGFIIDPSRYPWNGNQQHQYRHEHWDQPGEVIFSGSGLLAKQARTSWAHRRHTRHFLATLRAAYEWHRNTRWLTYSHIDELPRSSEPKGGPEPLRIRLQSSDGQPAGCPQTAKADFY